MCQRLFLAADRPLSSVRANLPIAARYPSLEVGDCNMEAGSYSVTIQQVRALLQLPYLYLLWAHMNCGCGFYYYSAGNVEFILSKLPENADPDDQLNTNRDLGYASVTSLGRYLADHLDAGPIFLYATWVQEEGTKPITLRRTVTPSFFGGPSFDQLADNQLLRIEPDR